MVARVVRLRGRGAQTRRALRGHRGGHRRLRRLLRPRCRATARPSHRRSRLGDCQRTNRRSTPRDMEAISYYQVIAAAGHDTTKGVIAGGLLALIENPSQRSRFCGDKSVMSTAAEEMIRWSTPVKATMRTAARDTVVSGVRIRAGESVCLSYPSANPAPKGI